MPVLARWEGVVVDRHSSPGPERFDDRPELLASADRPAAGPRARPALRRLLLLAAVCLALLAAAAGPLPSAGPRPRPGPSPEGGAVEVLGGPTRGSLADDPAYVEAVRQRSWDDGTTSTAIIPTPPVPLRHVVFVGDVPGGRWALVVGRMTDSLAAVWLTGPPGATPGQLRPQPVRRDFVTDGPVSLIDPLTGALVVVAAPGDQVSVSARPVIDADGRTARSYLRADSPHGVAVLRMPAGDFPYSTAVSVRVARHGSIVLATHPEVVEATAPTPAIVIDFVRGLPAATGRQVAQTAAVDVLSGLGLRRDQVHVTGLWSGQIPRPGTITGLAAIVAVTVPSGAVVIDAQWIVPPAGDYFLGRACGQAIEPAGIPVDRRVVAMACDVLFGPDDTSMRTSLVVVGPPEVAIVRVLSRDGALLAEEHATDGVVVTRLPVATDRVEAVTAVGVSLGRVELLDLQGHVGR